MMEALENNEAMENQENEVEVVEKDGFWTKAKNVVTKHGKKIVGAVLLAGVGIVGYAIGKNSGKSSNDYDDLEIIDLDAVDDDSTEEE